MPLGATLHNYTSPYTSLSANQVAMAEDQERAHRRAREQALGLYGLGETAQSQRYALGMTPPQQTQRAFDTRSHRREYTVDVDVSTFNATTARNATEDAVVRLARQIADSLIPQIRQGMRMDTDYVHMRQRCSYRCTILPTGTPDYILVQEPEDVDRMRRALVDAGREVMEQREKQEALVQMLEEERLKNEALTQLWTEERKLNTMLTVSRGDAESETESGLSESPEDGAEAVLDEDCAPF